MEKTKFIAALSALSLLALPSMQGLEVKGEGVSVQGFELDEIYNIGDSLYISKSATLSEGDKTAKILSSCLTYPDGTNLSSSSYKLDAYGTYTLSLYGEGGMTYSKGFSVFQDVYSFQSSKSTIDYGSLNTYFARSGYPNGLRLGLSEGDTFRFAQPIDLSESKYQKLISWNLNDVSESPVVRSISVRLTDAYDSNNYFTITNSRGSYYYENYISTSYNGGRSVGLSKDDSGTIVIDDTSYRVSSTGGTKITGNNPTSKVLNNISYYLDSSDSDHYKIYAGNDQSQDYALVAEFNNSDVFSSSFSGFKTGLAYLSLTASGYSGIDTAPIEIGEIAGIYGDALNPMDYYKDTRKPLLEIASEKQAQVMGGIEIKIPEAKAYDETGLKGQVRSAVWYGYDSNSRRMVSTSNNRFTPDSLGVYTVIYEAEDVYGNLAQERIDLFVTEFGKEGISFEVRPFSSLKAGKKIRFDNFETVSLNDDCKVSIELTYPDGKKQTVSSVDDVELVCSGHYSAVYSYSDAFYSGQKTYEFDVEANLQATFASNEVSLPHYFMKGASYRLDAPSAYIYGENGMEKDDVLCYARFDGGEYQKANASDFSVSGSSKVQFKFAPKSNPSASFETGEVSIVDTGWDGRKVDLTRYFVGDFEGKNVQTEEGKNADFVRYEATAAGHGEMEFVNPLLFSGFNFNFKASAFESLTVTLSSLDASASIKIAFDSASVSVNGRKQTPNENWNSTGASILYSQSNSTLVVAGVSYQMENPFPDDTLLLKVEGEGLSSGDYIDVSMVGNQPFRSGSTRDRIAPMASVSFPERIGHRGDEIVISKPHVADVLTPISSSKVTLSVLKNVANEVTPVKDKNSGVALQSVGAFDSDYVVTLDDYGSYVFSYAISDGAENAVSGGLKDMVSVLDLEPPTIVNLPNSYTIKAGVASSLPSVEVKDNITQPGDFDIWHLVYDQKGVLTAQAKDGDQVTIVNKGTYKVYVMAQDEEGNTAYGEYTLIVE